jgi:uncharacterized OsmC-like protein
LEQAKLEDLMSNSLEIRAALERMATIFHRKPSAALSTASGSAHVGDGLECTYRQDGREAVMDMPKAMGGGGEAPTPGFFFRASVAGCVAIGIKMMASRRGIELASVDVDVEMDFDDGALVGVGSNSAAPLETRLTIRLASAAPREKLDELVGLALAADPFFLALRDQQKVRTTIVAEAA